MGHIFEHCCHSNDGTNIKEAISIYDLEKESGRECNEKTEVEGG